jgi:hypothetical protein
MKVSEFEEQRFILLKASNNHTIRSDVGDGTGDGDGTDDGNAAQVLIMTFAGSTLVVGGFPRPEFKGTLVEALKVSGVSADILFVTDPSQSFYLKCPEKGWDGGDFYAEKLKAFSRGYRRVIAIGSSMGATGILHLASRFGCDTSVVFNPLVDVRSDTRFMFWLGGLRIPCRIRNALPAKIAGGFSGSGNGGSRLVSVG